MFQVSTDRVLAVAVLILALAGVAGAISAQWYGPRPASFMLSLALLLGCGVPAGLLLLRQPQRIADPLLWFLIASGVYFGFGPLAYHFATPQTVAFMDAFYPVTEVNLYKSGMVSLAGIAVALAAALVLRRFAPWRWASEPAKTAASDDRSLKLCAAVLLCVGAVVRYGLVVPRGLGFLMWTTPGSIEMLGELLKGGLALAVVLALRGHRPWKVIATVVAAADIVAGMLLLSKLEVLSVIVVAGVAEQVVRPGFLRLLRTGLVMVLVYLAMVPLVGIGRVHGYAALSDPSALNESARAVTLKGQGETNIQVWWARFAYTNQQSFALDAYDRGEPGDTITAGLKAGFIPRVLYPDKPILTPGGRFTEHVLGRDIQTATCPTSFTEGYWNGGWAGVVAVAAWIGFLLGMFSWLTRWIMASGRYEYLPVLLFGLKMGYRPDDWFVITYVLPAVFALLVFAGIRFLLAPARSRLNGAARILDDNKVES